MLSIGPVRTSFDFDGAGKRAGFIDLPHSDGDLAFSAVRVPVGVIAGGSGPTVLMTAGNHGDEYEGQAILHRLMRGLTPGQVQGRLILLPALNAPAVSARRRVSPLDGGNMNRSFPGDPGKGPTGAIAAFVTAHLLPRADVVLDFHSGGAATRYVDCGFLCIGPDANLNEANLALADAFGAPFTMICPIDGTGGDFDTAAHLRGKRFLACELGGMGTLSDESFTIGWNGALRVLRHLGCVAQPDLPDPHETRFIEAGPDAGFATAAHHGLAEIRVRLGQDVAKGDALATLFDTHNFGEIRGKISAAQGGVVSVIRRNPMVRPGDHLCLVSREIPRADILTDRMRAS
ncbi:succinylglutamate desuccinylase/aspartoacylase family protein [Defluviimonas sp. D31]|uniref:succinylglutamate desuccinylase/aspartoacylase family protein n=1 Tax=Defluviimonas sp. D31 TaxID=3083253 RepID=UPI00296E57DE|nr:succinylglutamate desuccinylase/aspartoacylase family protein [Defluviimonas sp. D31]MDW4551221.1 succinylglutamate desuccinylase/aspartoacylase family protein [Defluviimonas sp. D31]